MATGDVDLRTADDTRWYPKAWKALIDDAEAKGLMSPQGAAENQVHPNILKPLLSKKWPQASLLLEFS